MIKIDSRYILANYLKNHQIILIPKLKELAARIEKRLKRKKVYVDISRDSIRTALATYPLIFVNRSDGGN